MAVDTPATIAVLGAGPIGLEAALYARYLGYEVVLYERGQVVEHVRRWGHARLFTPWRMNVSPLGLAALRAQEPAWQPAADEAVLTGRELAQRYWLPLAQTDLLTDSVQPQTEVVAVGRRRLLKHDRVADDERGEREFLILVRSGDGERVDKADVVIDCTGTFGQSNWLGRGGLPAIGELEHGGRIERGLPDLAGEAAAHFAGRRVLVVGAGHSAATNVIGLARLEPAAHVTWVTRHAIDGNADGPVVRVDQDPLPERMALVEAANRLARGNSEHVEHRPKTWVKSLAWNSEFDRFDVRLSGEQGEIEVDRIIANVGYRPDHRLAAELQVQFSPETEAPLPDPAALAGRVEDAARYSDAARRLVLHEPDYYILGAKSRGRDSHFLIADGIEQVRALFTIIGDRAELDLYCTIRGRT